MLAAWLTRCFIRDHPRTGGKIFLRDNASDVIFRPERDAHGELVPCGKWSAEHGALLDEAVLKEIEQPAKDERSSAHQNDDEEAEEKPMSKRRKKELAMAQLVTRTLPKLNFVVDVWFFRPAFSLSTCLARFLF